MLKRLGLWIFKSYCHPDFQEDILGDLEEYYEWNTERKGAKYADRKFFLDAILLFRLSLLKDNLLTQNIIYTTMVKNNFKMAYRSMMRHKFYSLLNLVGLAISMTVCVFIAIYVQNELSFDKHIKDSDRIFRIATHIKYADNLFNIPAAPDPMAKALKEDFPEIEFAARTHNNSTNLVEVDSKFFRQSGVTYADQSFFDLFDFPLLRGDKEHLLDEPNTTVLEESTAKKLFGEKDPIGQIIKYNEQFDLKVTGVIEDIPENTHFDYDMFITTLNDRGASQNIWLSNNFITYLKLSDGHTKESLEAKIPEFIERHIGPQVKRLMNVSYKEAEASGNLSINYYLQPLESIHLRSKLDFELGETGTINQVYMFSIIGLFILLIACINFMNMSTARASVRAKEVGVRKVLGSMRKQLISQFLTESIINAGLAMILAVGMVYLILPGFNQLTGKSIIDPIFGANGLWLSLLIGTIIIGILAGIYPAFILSSFRPIKVIKGELTSGKGSTWMRNILVVVQFATSIFLIIASIVIYSQLDYLQSKKLGFNKDQILIINETQLLGKQIESFKNELEKQAIIESVSVSGYIPGTNINSDTPLLREDATSPDDGVAIQHWSVDYDYIETFDIELIQGRFFSEDFASDSTAVVVNETALRRFGYLEDPIGKKVKTLAGIAGNTAQTFTIIGVMRDFQFKSMTETIQPHALLLEYSPGAVNVKFNKESAAEVISSVESIWNKFAEGRPFEYSFLDQIFESSFRDQNRDKTIFAIFAALAIIIACLGLFGLAAFITEQRKKEIGIRKVLGASTQTLLRLLFSNFTSLILISSVIAIPVVWWYLSGWLVDYPEAISLSPMFFVLGVFIVLTIAMLTVGFQSFKAAKRNPIDNLRYE